jgi:delta1-piperideine-2-carboxylate reductase
VTAKARSQGIAALTIRNAHHFAALWPDVEPFAEAGLVALATVSARSRIVPEPGLAPVLGTNPLAFACPRAGGPPIVFDQASSVTSQGNVLLARRAGRAVPEGVGIDAAGRVSTDPAAILDGGALLAYGGYKGFDIALMAELMAAALTGGRFGFEDFADAPAGAPTSKTGEYIVVIDPERSAGSGFAGRVALLAERLRAAGQPRLPGDRRYEMRQRAERDGIRLPAAEHAALVALGGKRS